MNVIKMKSQLPPVKWGGHEIGGVVLIHSDRKHILMVHQARSDKWSIPKGHTKVGEMTFDCAVRELYEETNIALDEHVKMGSRIQSSYGDAYCLLLSPDHVCDLNSNDVNEIDRVKWMNLEEIRRHWSQFNLFTKTTLDLMGLKMNKHMLWGFDKQMPAHGRSSMVSSWRRVV